MSLIDLAKDRFEYEDWDLVGPRKVKPGDDPSDEIVIFAKPMLTNWTTAHASFSPRSRSSERSRSICSSTGSMMSASRESRSNST